MKKIRFGLIGSGWRAEFYIRIAKALPQQFELTKVLIRDKEKGEQFKKLHGVEVVQTVEELEADQPDYVVLAIKRGIISGYLPKLFEKGIPVLCETPPGEDIEALNSVWKAYEKYQAKIQIAEQYFAQPLYAAWEKVIKEGKIGRVENINISALHGYHGASIIRRFLNAGFENVVIYGKRFWFDVTETYGRDGMIFDGEVFQCSRERLTLEFDNGTVAYFDFSDPAQYHSFIRTRQLTVQGVRGEIDDMTIRYLTEENIPVTQELNRIDLGVYGNQEWAHYGIMLGEEFLYKNPFKNARFNDDEIAVATCMLKMGEYVKTGQEFYSLREALQDMYISLKMDEALANPNKEIRTETQIWAK
ncbi:Gfo/Idh/MocA family oxidoreductase [Mediterraneibacter sp. NSJ-55]|uniref:Gfo/Idh/MocA family oxidoreductase n=1 Tax=Mediterraneibacter hominis TaxID=2763054 RepID=A0A923LJ37_9FIRM|nr:Gfo/Idh/MocA family oxidoreductase [Mediterraneibacter hominis]MBC5689636.1 Gfo/Idh/MocA family oxidoreductase [Mediterraneibacter hominis]